MNYKTISLVLAWAFAVSFVLNIFLLVFIIPLINRDRKDLKKRFETLYHELTQPSSTKISKK